MLDANRIPPTTSPDRDGLASVLFNDVRYSTSQACRLVLVQKYPAFVGTPTYRFKTTVYINGRVGKSVLVHIY